jgi:transposase
MATGETTDPRDRELEALRRENADLRDQLTEIPKLKSRISDLERELAKAVRKLEEAVRAQKRQAAPFSKGPPNPDPKPPGRKAGDSYGVKARREPPEKVDEIIPVPLPPACTECGGDLEPVDTVVQFQEEIPRKPIVRRFDIAVGCCLRCGKRCQGRHPLQTSDAIGAAAPQLGPDAQTMVSLMKNRLGLSYGDIACALDDFYGIRLSRGGASHMVLRAGRRVDAAYRGIQIVIRRSRILYPDETGWRVGGLLQWLWTFVGKTATLFVIRNSRGHDVLEEILGLDWAGKMTHDGWSPYDLLLKALHQQCLQHLIRRCKDLLESATRGAVRFPRAVLELLHDAFALRDRRDEGELSPHGLLVAVGRLQARVEGLLEWTLSNSANLKFQNHLANHHDELFLFLKHPGLEGTSWPADQASRPAIVNRKVFGGNREPAGARAQECLASIVATCVQRGVRVFDYLSRVLRAPPERRDSIACKLLSLPAPG